MTAMRAADLDDARLVARCRAGDQQAWNELVERFSRYVYSITTRAFRLPEHDAEDVFQETFARLWQGLDRLRDDAAIRPWIGQLVRRLCIDRLRAGGRDIPTDVDVLPDRVEESVARIDEALDVRAALATLPERCQEILDRFFARDETYAVIGEVLGIPPGTIASRISRCLAGLREALAGRSEPAGAS